MKPTKTIFIWCLTALFAVGVVSSCSSDKGEGSSEEPKTTGIKKIEVDPMDDIGIGPISSVELAAEVDQTMVAKGLEVFEAKCTACHRPDEKFIGPPPKGILDRRSPEWIMNMILNPEEMVQKNDMAKALLMEYNGSPMANQNLTEEEARAVLEYFRTIE